ncbi:DNA polymerase III subunit beta [Candidatus Parcubacteria bacterium]|nr:MAG: DNA polymerase III subunit beta [Candidatus Parcubacteria bacterium]
MKISTLQENLKNGLSLVSHIAGKNVNLPILNNILINADSEGIKLISTNLEIGITCFIRGKIEKEGNFTVNSKIISDYISLLANKKVNIELKKEELVVESDNYKTVIKGEKADDFPLIPQINKETYFKTKINDFKKALSKTIFAVSNSETRMELSGVLFVFDKDNLTIAATDSYRLAEKQIKIESNTKMESKVIIPVKTLQEVLRVLSNVKIEELDERESEIEFYLSDNQIMFSIDKIEVVSRVIEGQYPDYKQIIPKDSKTEIMINRNEFIRAIKAASIFSKTGVNDINLDFTIDKNITLISSSSGITGENKTEIESKITGSDNGIVLNYIYLLEGVNSINTENIILKIIDLNTPCVLKADNGDDYIYIIMPIKQ